MPRRSQVKVKDVLAATGWELLTPTLPALENEIQGGYVADLLSCVMAGAQPDQLWFTLQTHSNIVAVASLTGVAAVVICEGAAVGADTVQKAAEQGVVLLRSAAPVYETVKQAIALGL